MTIEKPPLASDNDETAATAANSFSTLWKQTTIETVDDSMEDTEEETDKENNENQWTTIKNKNNKKQTKKDRNRTVSIHHGRLTSG